MKKYRIVFGIMCVIAAMILIGRNEILYAQAEENSTTENEDFLVIDGVLVEYYGNEEEVVIPDTLGITSIGRCAFTNSNKLRSVMLPEGIKSIGEGAFQGCQYLETVLGAYGLQSIGNCAFYQCKNLDNTILSGNSTIRNIGTCAFYDCDSLTDIFLDGVRNIGSEAFYDCDNLKEVILPEEISFLGDHAFSQCQKLRSVMVCQGEGISYEQGASMGYEVFSECTNLEEVCLPDGIKKIGDRAFYQCSKLTDVTIRTTTTDIGYEAFKDCGNLKSIILPYEMNSIEYGAFENTGLTSIVIPSGITDIYSRTFFGTELKKIELPGSLRSIGDYAFYGACYLKSIKLPNKLYSIGDYAFAEGKLESIMIPKYTGYIGKGAFTNRGDDSFLIKCAKDSYAEKYAKKNDFRYKYFDYQTITAVSDKIRKTYGNNPFSLKAKTDGGGKLTYKSSNEKVVKVNSKGKVTIKGCGKAVITIKAEAKGTYKAGKKKIEITVQPKKPAIKSLKSNNSKKMTVTWARDKKASGYIIQYSTKEYYSLYHLKTITVSKNSVTSKTIGKLKPGKKYYVKILSYKTVDGKKIKGNWSKQKSVIIRK